MSEGLELTASTTTNGTVHCPAGTTVISGGYGLVSGSPSAYSVYQNLPVEGGWFVGAYNDAGFSIDLEIYALCAQLSD